MRERSVRRWTYVLLAGFVVWYCQPGTPIDWKSGSEVAKFPSWNPDHNFSQAWRLLSIFVATVVGLICEPLPGGAMVLLALIVAILTGALSAKDALGGFSDTTVWLVLAAFLISRAFIKTGLAKRIALTFVRLMGRNSLGLGYSLAAADIVLAGMIPSNGARVGGVILPIARSIAEIYKSLPGPTASMLGCYLIVALYQVDVMACALFITGQASNVLAADQARTISNGKVVLDYSTWFVRASVPALACLAVIPWLVFRLSTPTIVATPKAAEFAKDELTKLGKPRWQELYLVGVFLVVCGLWIRLDYSQTAIVALGGVAALLIAGVITWEEAMREEKAWDVFIWYGGLVQIGKMLQQQGLMELFAKSTIGYLSGWTGMGLFLIATAIYFFSHYGFASITTHILSLFAAFAKVLIVAGLPASLVLTALPLITNFSAGLTHYGTTPGPILFGTGYVTQRLWWRVGLCMASMNLAIWLILGLAWWKFLGLW